MKILVLTENPSSHTGMAKVGREIATALHVAEHEVIYLCCGEKHPDQKEFPFKLIGVNNDSWGADIFDSIIYAERPDVVLTIGDPWFYDYLVDRNACKSRNLFQWIGYVAVDGEALGGGLPNFWGRIINEMDRVIAYTDYGKEAILKSFPHLEDTIDMIYHGVDDTVFYPMSPEEKKRQRRNRNLSDKFIFLVVARNQGRKNWPELFKAWKIIQEEKLCPNAVLWPHTYFYDRVGNNIDDMMETFKLGDTSSIIFFAQIARGNSAIKLMSTSDLNILYNMADCLISIGGEGFGLPVIEAMATKTPCIVLNHSATAELGGEGRAELVEPCHYLTGKYLTERPVPDPIELAKVMQKMYEKSIEDKREMMDDAYLLAKENTWQRVGARWQVFFDKLENPTRYPIVLKEVA